MVSSYLRRLQRNHWRKEENRPRYPFNFNFISGFNKYSLGEENYSWIQMKWLCLQDKVLEYTSHFRSLISLNWVFLCYWFRRCRLTGSRHGVRLPNLIGHVFAASGRVKIYIYIYSNPDIRELSGPDKKSLISVFLLYPGLVYFI